MHIQQCDPQHRVGQLRVLLQPELPLGYCLAPALLLTATDSAVNLCTFSPSPFPGVAVWQLNLRWWT